MTMLLLQITQWTPLEASINLQTMTKSEGQVSFDGLKLPSTIPMPAYPTVEPMFLSIYPPPDYVSPYTHVVVAPPLELAPPSHEQAPPLPDFMGILHDISVAMATRFWWVFLEDEYFWFSVCLLCCPFWGNQWLSSLVYWVVRFRSTCFRGNGCYSCSSRASPWVRISFPSSGRGWGRWCYELISTLGWLIGGSSSQDFWVFFFPVTKRGRLVLFGCSKGERLSFLLWYFLGRWEKSWSVITYYATLLFLGLHACYTIDLACLADYGYYYGLAWLGSLISALLRKYIEWLI